MSNETQQQRDTVTREILARLQRACEQQDNSIKQLREPLINQSANATQRSTAVSELNSSHGVSGEGSRPSQFHVACDRRWNQQMQKIVTNEATPPLEKRAAVNKLLAEFQLEAAAVVSRFLAKYLGDEEDEGKPSKAALELQWATATQISSGQFLTVALLDCQDSTAFALTAKDYKAQLLLLGQNIGFSTKTLVHVFPKALIRHRGRALSVTAEMSPIGDSFLAWQCPELTLAMAVAADTLNLAPYYLPADEDDLAETTMLLDSANANVAQNAAANFPILASQQGFTAPKFPHWGSLSAKARRCADGRLYVESLLDLMPHFPPAKNERINNKRHTLYIRPEAVARSPVALGPGAFIVYGTQDSTKRNADVRESTRRICMTSVVTLAQTIDAVGAPLTSADLSKMLHDSGVNISLLAIILTHLKRVEARTVVLSEMVARVSRDYLLREMSRYVELDDSNKAVSEYFAELSDPANLLAMWNDELVPRMGKKFPGFATFFGQGSANSQITLQWLDRNYLLQTVPLLVGVRFAKGVSIAGTSTFHYCVAESYPVVKPLKLPGILLSGIGVVQNESDILEQSESLSVAAPPETPSQTLSYSILWGLRKSRRAAASDDLGALQQQEKQEEQEEAQDEEIVVSRLHSKLASYAAFERSANSAAGPPSQLSRNPSLGEPDADLYLAQRKLFLCNAFGGFPVNNTVHMVFALLEAASVSEPAQSMKFLVAANTALEKVFSAPSGPGPTGDGGVYYSSGRLLEVVLQTSLGIAYEAAGLVPSAIKALEAAYSIASSLNTPAEFAPLRESATASNTRPTSSTSQQVMSQSSVRRTSGSSQAQTPCGESLVDVHVAAYTLAAADIASMLAVVLERQAMHEEASPYFRYAREAYHFFLGDVDSIVSMATNSLAVNLYSLGKFDEAELLYREDLRISELLFGEDSVNVAQTLNNLACLLDRVDRNDESEALYLRDIGITTKALGVDHPDVATSRNNLGANYLKRGELAKAETLLQEALAVREKRFGETSVPAAEVLNNIGALYKKKKQLKEAREIWERALQIYGTCVGQTSIMLLGTLENLHLLVEEQGDYAEAERLMERMSEVKRSESATYFETKGGKP